MKRILLFTSLVLVILGTMLTASAAPAALPVETAGENSEVVDLAAEGAVAADYTPTPSEYENGEYGIPIVWEGYEGFDVGVNARDKGAAYTDQTKVSGFSSFGYPDGVVALDSETGKKYIKVAGSRYPGLSNSTAGLSGTYTVVIKARKAASADGVDLATKVRPLFRGRKWSDANQKLEDYAFSWPAPLTLTDEFTEKAFTYNYYGYDEKAYFCQIQMYPEGGTVSTVGDSYELDSYAIYYKPFENYEKPELGNVVYYEGYEGYTNGTAVKDKAVSVFNADSGSNLNSMPSFNGTVTTVSSTGKHYATIYHDTNNPWQHYRGISNGKNSKAGTYTVVFSARKGASSKLEFYIRGIGPKASDPSATEDKNWASKAFTLTDEFAEYSVSYEYIPDGGVNYLNQLLILPGAGIEVDYYGLYFKPYEGPTSYEKTSIRVNDPAGIRFRASVKDSERKHSALTEYGFIVTTEALLTAKGVEASNFTFDTDVTKVTGANYQVVDGEVKVDKIFSTDGGVTNFTAIIYNIPTHAYAQNLVVRPYIKFGSDIYYGKPMVDNIAAVAERIKTNNPEEYVTNQLAYDNILAGKNINAPAA